MKYDYEVDPDPPTAAATVLRRLAPVLDLGCAAGGLTHLMRTLRACMVTGVEVDLVAAARARWRELDLRVGDVRDPAFQAALEAEGPFGQVVCADILEHLPDPESVLTAARAGWHRGRLASLDGQHGLRAGVGGACGRPAAAPRPRTPGPHAPALLHRSSVYKWPGGNSSGRPCKRSGGRSGAARVLADR